MYTSRRCLQFAWHRQSCLPTHQREEHEMAEAGVEVWLQLQLLYLPAGGVSARIIVLALIITWQSLHSFDLVP